MAMDTGSPLGAADPVEANNLHRLDYLVRR
jgi:hypothetical protein